LSILIDTDVLSAFAKISGLELMNDLFSSEEMLITNGVYEELAYIRDSGYDFVDRIFSFVRNTPMNEAELDMYHSFLKRTSLGKGGIAVHRGLHRAGSSIHHKRQKGKEFRQRKRCCDLGHT